MKYCQFCKTEIEIAGKCPICGDFKGGYAANFLFGTTKNEMSSCEVYLTTKYIIIRKRSKGSFLGQTVAAAAGGIVGATIAANAEKGRMRELGYYSLSNIKCAIFPYKNNKIKNNLAVKIINKDNSDFILLFNLNGLTSGMIAKNFMKSFSTLGILVENGLSQNFGDVFCTNPFVNIDTFGTYISAPEDEKNNSEDGALESNHSEVRKKTASQTYYESKPKFCYKCGYSLTENDKFCRKCGERVI